MCAFPQLLLVATMVLCTGALAQARKDAPTPPAPNSAATTGAAPTTPHAQAPVGHREPRPDALPEGGTKAPLVSPYDQEIDRNLRICRDC